MNNVIYFNSLGALYYFIINYRDIYIYIQYSDNEFLTPLYFLST